MSEYKDRLKKKWQEKESGAIRGKMKSLVGRGDGDDTPRTTHAAQPLSSLRDPSSFGPPPVRRTFTNSPTDTSSPSHGPYATQSAEEDARSAPQLPYRADTTGLSTAHLLPPPGRRGTNPSADSPPLPYTATPPRLPPRLPPRSSSSGGPPALPSRTGSSTGVAQPSQGAISRLSAAGISVPSLGIGGRTPAPPPPAPPRRSPAPAPSPPPRNTATSTSSNSMSQLGELQSRFSRLGTSSHTAQAPSPSAQTEPGQGRGASFGQKQAALQTASAFRRDPGSVSASDARAALSTANNFRQRHGDQVTAGLRGASSLHDKYGGQVNTYDGSRDGNSGQSQCQGQGQGQVHGQGLGDALSAAAILTKKKPAPPPPPKRAGLGFGGGEGDANPPSVPLGTRPRF